MKKPVLLLDVDGPLTAGFVEEACRILRTYDIPNRDACYPQHVGEWDLMKALGIPKHIENEVYERLRTPGIAFDFAPNDGAKEFVAEVEKWVDVYIVTSPLGGAHWAHDRERWLQHHFGISSQRVISARTKHLVKGDFFVDDKLSHLEAWHKEFSQGVPVLWRTPSNQTDTWPYIVSNYDELRAILNLWNVK